ncbi:hypothetical protein NVS55_16840 [Myxococcus stipitatus]|uniref:hypothetical protein n=1 Tax=Myxococcus stipitatus TaxID=83455 RepID=UPI0031453945
MSTLVFPTEEALHLALTSRLIPPEVQAAPAQHRRTADGAVYVTPQKPLPKPVLAQLGSLGIRSEPAAPPGASPALCWAELVPPRRVAVESAPSGAVLFLPKSAEGLLPLAGELLRLGCDRQEACFAQAPGGDGGPRQRAMLRTVGPPYFTLTGAMDRLGGLRAFVPAIPGQSSVWVELGHVHPLASTLQPSPGSVLLIPGDGPWLSVSDGPWTDLYQLTDLRLPQPAEDWAPAPAPGRLSVQLRLTRAARTEAASLWVLRENAVAQVESLVHTLPETLLAQLRFAVVHSPEGPCVILRARHGRERPPELGLSAMAYAPLPQLADLYLPCDGLLEPPVRRDRLRALLAPVPDTVTWLHPTGGGGFRAERVPEQAFQPLDTWVDYVVDASAAALEPWVKGALFDFDSLEVAEGEWMPGRARAASAMESADPASTQRSQRSRREEPPAPVSTTVRVSTTKSSATRGTGAPMEALTPAKVSAMEAALTVVQRAFLKLDAPADAPERQEMWTQMAEMNGRLGRGQDAALCWTRALWNAPKEQASELAAHWAEAEARDGVSLDERLSRAEPSADDVRALASALIEAALTTSKVPASDVPTVQRWMDRHDTVLDVRTLWLSRTALDTLAGGDALGLARAGDRLLAMLQRGLSLSRDVPRFLRGGTDASVLPQLLSQLDALHDRFERTPRRRSSVEAPPPLTRAYVHFVFACGYARLGQADRARELAASAKGSLSTSDAIHVFLTRAYSARIEQALEGTPLEAPLPPDIAAELNALGTFERYKVDRLRQASAFLEPGERLDPAKAFGRGTRDVRGEEFAALRDLREPETLAHEVAQLVKRAIGARLQAPERTRLIGGLLETLPRLPPARALPLMDELLPAMDGLSGEVRAKLLGDALTLAAMFGRADRATALAKRLRAVLSELAPESPAWAEGLLGASLRGLRRVGLSAEAGALVESTRGLLTHAKAPVAARLGVASGLAMLGRVEEALPVFDQAFKALAAAKGPQPERLALTRTLASALAHAPVDTALPGLARLSEALPTVTDSFNTNSHFCLSVVDFADALVLGHVEVGQGAGERARSWLDEDEFLVRRRIHQELEERL